MDNSDKQMEMLLEEGGIADDGMNVDPVSGNEIPPGSMASEVRDDIPAQLSEGEYVVPADVLRFYGVKFFEDLRAEAKMGLAGMEANGRIGGEPVPASGMSGGDDLTPEEMAALEGMMMAVGGFVPQPTQSTQPDPYMQQQAMYNQGAPVAMGNAGYNEGGYATGSFDPSQFQPGFSFLGDSPTTMSDIRTVTMYGPNGEIETLTLPAQQSRYDELLSMSYSETPVATTTETTVGVQEEFDGGPGFDTGDLSTGPSISEMGAEELSEAAKGLKAMDTVAGVVAAFSPVVGLGIKGLSKSQENAINNRAEELGIESPLGKDDSDDEGFLSSIISDVTDFFTGKTTATVATGRPPVGTPVSTDDKSSGGRDLDADLGIGATSGVDTSSAAQEASDLGFGDVDTGEFGGMGPSAAEEAQAAAAAAAEDLGMDGPATGGR